MIQNDDCQKLETLLSLCKAYRTSLEHLDWVIDKPSDSKKSVPILEKIYWIYALLDKTISRYSKFKDKVVLNQHHWNMWSIYDVAFGNYEMYFVSSSLNKVITDLIFILSKLKSMETKEEWPEFWFWMLLHADIVKVSRSRFESEHYADAVEAAFKCINSIIKKICKDRTGEERDWSDLMKYVFSLKKPLIKLWNLDSQDGKSIQLWYMEIFAWSMTGIRNPKAHGNLTISKEKCIHFLFLASLLRMKIDEEIEST